MQVLITVKARPSALIVDEWHLATAFVFARKASDGFFGEKLVSLRSIVVSLLITAVSAILFLYIAYISSPAEFREEYIIAVAATWRDYPQLFLTFWLLSSIVDFFSVVQTRFFLRFIKVDMNWLVLIGLLAFDVLASLIIFMTTIPFVTATTYILGVVQYDETASFSDILAAIQRLGGGLLLSAYIQDFMDLAKQIILHPVSSFNYYTVVAIGCGYGTELFCSKYPYTTFLSTNFSTSIWLWISGLTAVGVRLILLEKRLADAASRVATTRRMLVYLGIFLSLLAGFALI